jgi:hypothetical protein
MSHLQSMGYRYHIGSYILAPYYYISVYHLYLRVMAHFRSPSIVF